MALTSLDSGTTGQENAEYTHSFQADGQERIELPSGDFIADAKMTRDGDNLVLETPNGETAVIEGYFSAEPCPLLQSADGATLTPNLVEAFSRSPLEFAANDSASDESPVGAVEEVKGNATVTRADGTVETITIGTPIYQGDIIETDAAGAVNIVFIDETSMAVSENARLAIDEYTFDPSTESGTTNFSVLRGLFVFTSGLIGRDDPDDVSIDTPVGSIGIRGTVIAGEINPSGESNITVLEGAIVVTNGSGETVLSDQFQTVRLGSFSEPMKDLGVLPANDIGTRFNSIGDVNPGLFTTINDAAKEQSTNSQSPTQHTVESSPQAESVHEAAQTSAAEVPAAPPVAAPPSPMDPGFATLDGNSSGLPSHNTITGQPAHSTAAVTTASTPDAVGHTAAPTPIAPTPVSTTPPAPPSVVDQPAPPTTVTPPVTGTVLTYTAAALNDLAGEHDLVARIGAPTGTGITSYTITSANSAYFDVVVDSTGANITLTQAGMDFLGDSLDVRQLGPITVEAITAGSQTLTITGTTNVTDAHTAGQIINLDAGSSALTAQRVAMISDSINNNAGYDIAALGDIDNDGFDDFAITRNTNAAGQNFSSQILGSAGILPSGNLPGTPILPLPNNTTTSGNFGGTVLAGVGDFDGDGVEDYVVGQADNNAGGIIGSGVAVIVSGANHNSFIGFTNGAVAGQIGYSVAGAGDFNNDGYADVLIGAPGLDTVYFMHGRDTSWTGNIGSQAELLTGDTGFGTSVAGIGDFNGDGYADFVVGAPQAGGSTNGSVQMYFGNANGTTTVSDMIMGEAGEGLGEDAFGIGDINGDGLSDMIVGTNNNGGKIFFGMGGNTIGTAAVELDIPAGGTNNYVITGGGGIGDFNGDGYDDFVIAIGDNDSTSAYVVYGKQDWSTTSTIDASYLKNPENAQEIRYNGANNAHDIEISGIGDINGDGYDDFAIGLPDVNGGAAGNGGFAVIYGRDTGAVDRSGANPIAQSNGEALVATTGNNVLNDGGYSGVSMRGGAGMDTFHVSDANFLGIHGGGGTDTIRALGNLDFTNVNFEQVSGIEQIMFGAENRTITLTMENLFNMLKTSSDGTLSISSGGWINQNLVLTDSSGIDDYTGSESDQMLAFLNEATGGTTNVQHTSSGGVDTFTIGGYTLMIDQAITVDAQ